MMHHIDVVPAGEGWRTAPFSGRLLDGKIWGRGAIDIKSLGLAQLDALGQLKAAGRKFCRDVVFLGVADEEAGGGRGSPTAGGGTHSGYLPLPSPPLAAASLEGVVGEGLDSAWFGLSWLDRLSNAGLLCPEPMRLPW